MVDVADIIVDVKSLTRLSDVLSPEHLENLRKYLVSKDEMHQRAHDEMADKLWVGHFYMKDESVKESMLGAIHIAENYWPSRFK